MVDVNDIIDRLKTMLNVRHDTDLAKHFGRSPHNIYTWRDRNSLDFRFLIEFFWDEDLNYIFKGERYNNDTAKHVKETVADYSSTDNMLKKIERLQIENEILKELILKLKTVSK